MIAIDPLPTAAAWEAMRFCAGCAPAGECQLGLVDQPTRDGIAGTVTFTERHAGAPSAVHGGFIAAVLDELSGKVAMAAGVIAVTKTLEIRYLHPTPIGVRLGAASYLRALDGRAWTIEARIHDS